MKEIKITERRGHVQRGERMRISIEGEDINKALGVVCSKKDQGKKLEESKGKQEGGKSDAELMSQMIKVRQRHTVSTDDGIVSGSFMSKEQKLTLAQEAIEGRESRELTDKVNREMEIVD
jgi:hypothetical protein